MSDEIIFKSAHLAIYREKNSYYAESFMEGMTLKEFSQIIERYPEIRITSFPALHSVLSRPPHPLVKFGERKERIRVELAADQMQAYVVLAMDENALKREDRDELYKDILSCLDKAGVVFGIRGKEMLNDFPRKKNLLAAEGLSPQKGQDATIKMYKLKDSVPVIREDGNADFYDLNIINPVEEGEWLGERREPTGGAAGKTVTGITLPALPGRQLPLYYDSSSVDIKSSDGLTTLHAKHKGAVYYKNERIYVANFLEIKEDINFKTGNIQFDGFLRINGTVSDNFSVEALKDIEINGEYGIGCVKKVESRDGSVYIRGGIAGKSKAVIQSSKNIYTKFVSDATIVCQGDVHIGFYCFNSNITARRVFLESPKGQIVGGRIEANVKVDAPFIGNESERRTVISLKGFERKVYKEKYDQLEQELQNLQRTTMSARQNIFLYENAYGVESGQEAELMRAKERYHLLKTEEKNLKQEIKQIADYLAVKGNGEISVRSRIYPNTVLEYGSSMKVIQQTLPTTSFYIKEGQLHEF